MQQQQLAAQQQAALQKQILAQQMLAGGGAAGLAAAAGAAAGGLTDKRQREVYIGNLAMGQVTADMLREFFNQAFSHLTPDPVNAPPVTRSAMEGPSRYAFVEFRTEEMTLVALSMDKVVELCGRPLTIGRPKGWTPPLPSAAPAAAAAAGPTAPAAAPEQTLLLSNALPVSGVRQAEDRAVLAAEVREEAERHGRVEEVAVPAPPTSIQDAMPARVYIRYATPEDAKAAVAIFNKRTLDGNVIKAVLVPDEEWQDSRAGQWVTRHSSIAGIPLPGLYTKTPLPAGITGLAALNSALSALVQTNPGIATVLTAGINAEEVPLEEGYVKVRNLTPTVTKKDILDFFVGCGVQAESDVTLVYSADGTSLGEAFVHFSGPQARLRLGLSRDATVMPATARPVEVLTAVGEDLQRRIMSGCRLE
ncbi:hypothetical protein APUTEX25_005448 [Auxenochlorella protothecoides]|nr:hypothetical protein APUTEX25_005448 [Auxenochlorella protothecoides]|eukprot:RMZ55170.1 hypothetical protein APUTEX25_005448 [Auxenochlorella protothecoides]